MVVASYHNGAYNAVAHHFIEAQSYPRAALGVLIEYACLSSDNELVLFGVAYPVIVIPILEPAVGVDAFHSGMIRRNEV